MSCSCSLLVLQGVKNAYCQFKEVTVTHGRQISCILHFCSAIGCSYEMVRPLGAWIPKRLYEAQQNLSLFHGRQAKRKEVPFVDIMGRDA